MPTPEGDVLLPVKSTINSDNWEIFVLSDVQVVYESNGRPASLLAAYADTPLKVQGRLEAPERGQLKYLINRPYKPIDIEIRNVTRYSYGEMTDGEFVIWAQGQAGWFEIRPATSYKSMYADMVQAVALLYFVTDIQNEPRKKGAAPSPTQIFQECAEDKRFPCTDAAAAIDIFHRHHVFLIMCFLNRAQAIVWSSTQIYQHFRRQFPKAFDNCKARIEGRYAQIKGQPEKQTRAFKSSPALTTSAAQSKAGSGRGKTAVQKPEEVPKKDDNWWEAAAMFEFMQKAVNQRVLRAGRGHITIDRIAQLIVKRYEVDYADIAKNVLLVHAQNLCYMMDHPRRKNIRFFADEPIYLELAAGHNLTAVEQRRVEAVELRPRKDHATLKGEEPESSDTSDEEGDVITTPARRPPGRRKGARLSVLRPRSSNFSGKSKGKGIKRGKSKGGKGKAPVPDSDDEIEDTKDTESEGEMGIDTPTQALSPGREKRKLDVPDANENRRKRTASASIAPESPPTTASSSTSDTEPDTQDASVPPLPLRYRPTNITSASQPQSSHTSPAIVPSIVSTPLPTYEPNGPRDSWICNFDGCAQRIYGCSKEIGRQLITEHLEDHAKGREKVVGILWREQDKLHLPVSNLIKKIREMSEATTPLFPTLGTERAMPQSIHRHV